MESLLPETPNRALEWSESGVNRTCSAPLGTREAKLLDVTRNAVVRQGWVVNGQPQEVWIHLNGAAPSNQDLYLAPEAGVISVGFFSQLAQYKVTKPA